jgi:hypothetical protein
VDHAREGKHSKAGVLDLSQSVLLALGLIASLHSELVSERAQGITEKFERMSMEDSNSTFLRVKHASFVCMQD